MVKLPNEAYVPLPIGEMRNRYESNRNLYANRGPSRLIELEEFADLAAKTMPMNSTIPMRLNVRQIAMNRMRQLFNLEFKLRCDVCGTAHYQDEITAPER